MCKNFIKIHQHEIFISKVWTLFFIRTLATLKSYEYFLFVHFQLLNYELHKFIVWPFRQLVAF